MLHVTPQSACESARMSKLDELERLIVAIDKRRAQLAQQQSELRTALERTETALEAMNRVYQRAIELKDFVPDDMAHILNDGSLGRLATALDSSAPSENALQPTKVVAHVRDVLLEARKPMKRGELVKALLARNVPLAGKDKNKNLGTILWRHPNQFVSLEGLGYWLKDVPLEGIYVPQE